MKAVEKYSPQKKRFQFQALPYLYPWFAIPTDDVTPITLVERSIRVQLIHANLILGLLEDLMLTLKLFQF